MNNEKRRAGVWKQMIWPTFALVMLSFFVFLMLGLFMPGSQRSVSEHGGAVPAAQYVREGRIARLENGIAEFVTSSGERFIIDPQAEGFRLPEVGSLQRVALIPFRRSAENIYLARIRTMRKISQYSHEAGGGS
ncbi:MAG: hypothetical protein CVV42_08720 [Candidatus Riflebacteria bacterium HGW-Riflebacteria-2]|jgi:hypothetical protein|nr:MAG: hypothetical protein CVV42_08720 [Candidatus Riflebacteria bacterium HGW-Riflebacteria-2]